MVKIGCSVVDLLLEGSCVDGAQIAVAENRAGDRSARSGSQATGTDGFWEKPEEEEPVG